MQKSNVWFLTFFFVVLVFTACTKREDVTSFYANPIQFDAPRTVLLPETVTYAQKRGFGDFNGDGIEDMLEVNDEEFWGQDFKVQVFHGYYKDGILHFNAKHVKIDLPITMKWFSDATKLDIGDVNGDGYADVIFTQYTELWGENRMDVAFAINQGDNSFLPQAEKITFQGGVPLSQIIMVFIDSYGYVETLYDYLKMDWGDMDGNGSDDLILGWDSHDLSLEIIYTSVTHANYAEFTHQENFDIPEFMRNRSIYQLDVEDFNGDGKMDIFVHITMSHRNWLSVAINTGQGFEPHKDCVVDDVDMKFFAFEKYDTFDVNRDGQADFVHVGEKDDQKVMAYNLALASSR